MPSIITDQGQVKALNEINAALDDIKKINALLETGGEFRISSVKGKKDFTLDSVFSQKAAQLLLGQKAKLAGQIDKLAAKYRIQLDEDDRNCMGTADNS